VACSVRSGAVSDDLEKQKGASTNEAARIAERR